MLYEGVVKLMSLRCNWRPASLAASHEDSTGMPAVAAFWHVELDFGPLYSTLDRAKAMNIAQVGRYRLAVPERNGGG